MCSCRSCSQSLSTVSICSPMLCNVESCCTFSGSYIFQRGTSSFGGSWWSWSTAIMWIIHPSQRRSLITLFFTEPPPVYQGCRLLLEPRWRRWVWSSWWMWGGCETCCACSWLGVQDGDLDHIAADWRGRRTVNKTKVSFCLIFLDWMEDFIFGFVFVDFPCMMVS